MRRQSALACRGHICPGVPRAAVTPACTTMTLKASGGVQIALQQQAARMPGGQHGSQSRLLLRLAIDDNHQFPPLDPVAIFLYVLVGNTYPDQRTEPGTKSGPKGGSSENGTAARYLSAVYYAIFAGKCCHSNSC